MGDNFVIDKSVPCSGGSKVAVLLVGFENDYFIAKGSWG
jgi:hypothetical protein